MGTIKKAPNVPSKILKVIEKEFVWATDARHFCNKLFLNIILFIKQCRTLR